MHYTVWDNIFRAIEQSRGNGYTTATITSAPPNSIIIVPRFANKQHIIKETRRLNREDLIVMAVEEFKNPRGIDFTKTCIFIDNSTLYTLLRTLLSSERSYYEICDEASRLKKILDRNGIHYGK